MYRLLLSARIGHTSVTLPDTSMLIMGGFYSGIHDIEDVAFNDVWKSIDGGGTWGLLTLHAEWQGTAQIYF